MEISINKENGEALESYFDRISKLFFENKLNHDEAARVFAQSLTIATLQRLDSSRKYVLIKFLLAANLIRNEEILNSYVNRPQPQVRSIDIENFDLDNKPLPKEIEYEKSTISLERADLSGLSFVSGAYSSLGYKTNVRTRSVVEAHEFILSNYLFGIDLRGSNLSNVDFSSMKLWYSLFCKANLAYANFLYSQLVRSDFSRVLAVSTNFQHANMEGCKFIGAAFFGVRMQRANLKYAQFTEARLEPMNRIITDLSKSILVSADFRNATLNKVNLSHSHIIGADFRGARLEKVNFAGATYDNRTKWPEGFLPPQNAEKVNDNLYV